jgi:superfamily II DNA or RNA helicase
LFGSRERVALFLAADGRCQGCGVALEPGWHADHEEPWSRGGVTDVINGQALCPACNLRKGSTGAGMDLRVWQQEALDRFLSRRGNFLAVATPGAGKTTFAVTAATRLIEMDEITFVIVVVPTAHLRGQWASSAARSGLQLDHRFTNADGRPAKDFEGVAVTYQTVASQPALWRRLSTTQQTLVVFDEIHHAGDDENVAWGTALNEAFEHAARRLLLSGTPFRTDGSKIPFVEYDATGRAIPSYSYDYGKALRDGEVVRPIVFPAMDGEAKWRRSGEVTTTVVNLANTDKDTVPPALRAVLAPDGNWIPSVLGEANEALTKAREDTPDAAGLVIAASQEHAYQYAQLLQQISGETATVAVSDDPEASARIEGFARSSSRWIVAVQMVSEGVDIPRLAVGVYASRVRTQLFFIQVVGRFVRMRGPDDETMARLFIPTIDPLLTYARDIEKTVDAVIRDEENKVRERQRDDDGDGPAGPSLFSEVEVVGSSAATLHSTIASGESITPAEKARAEQVLAIAGGTIPRNVTPETIAIVLRLGGADSTPPAVPAQPGAKRLGDEKQEVRRLIRRKVGLLNLRTGREHKYIHAELNQMFGGTITTATLPQLMQRIDVLDRWLAGTE